MLVGYVSDERYVALADVAVSLVGSSARQVDVRSGANGAIHADVSAGEYEVTLAAEGFGSKRVGAKIGHGAPHQFRLLRDGLLGYVWPKWVRCGEEGEFRVHSDQEYHLSLWRYGECKELVQQIGWFDEHGPRATVQITPDGDYTQTGIEWNRYGYASPHHRQTIAAPQRSGLYWFHVRALSGAYFTFPWIVAPAVPTARVAVLAANITWNAYNSVGGRSNYIHPEGLPPTPTVNARLELRRYTDPDHVNYDRDEYPPLSFERPEPINHVEAEEQITSEIAGRAGCHLAPAEWRLCGWLEREGFAYDFYAETQFHFGQLPLDEYDVLILSTHPEYWSRQMYDELKAWVFDRGGKLMYLGGNGLNCEVEFLDESRCIYRNGDERRLRRGGGTLESRFHMRHESEANLLGVVFTDVGIMTAAPYRVIDAAHWVYEGTGLAAGDLFGQRSLHQRVPGGASGHETDKRSASSPPETHLLAQGTNPDGGGAEMVMHRTESDGVVFSVGSICWPSSLWVDEHVSQITRNVLLRFTSE